MADEKTIEDILGINPKLEDHGEPKVEEKPEEAMRRASQDDFTARFQEVLSSSNEQQKLMYEAMLNRMAEISGRNEEPKHEDVKDEKPAEYKPSGIFEALNTDTDKDIYEAFTQLDRASYERDKAYQEQIRQLADAVNKLTEASNNNLGYLESSVVSARFPDSDSIEKSEEFKNWIDDRDPIAKRAYNDVMSKGTAAEKIQVLELFKNSQDEKESKGKPDGDKRINEPADNNTSPGTLTDFQAGGEQDRTAQISELISDPVKMSKFFRGAGSHEEVLKRMDQLNEVAVAAGIF